MGLRQLLTVLQTFPCVAKHTIGWLPVHPKCACIRLVHFKPNDFYPFQAKQRKQQAVQGVRYAARSREFDARDKETISAVADGSGLIQVRCLGNLGGPGRLFQQPVCV